MEIKKKLDNLIIKAHSKGIKKLIVINKNKNKVYNVIKEITRIEKELNNKVTKTINKANNNNNILFNIYFI